MKIILGLLSAAAIAATSAHAFGSLLLFGAGGAGGSGGSPPAWVAAACPNNPAPQICIDFVGNQAWDGISSSPVAPSSLLSITRAGTESYQNTSGAFSTIPSGALAIGNAGLQIQGQINQLPSSTICTSATGGTCTFAAGWTDGNTGIALPSSFVHNIGDAPDGTDSDTVTFPAATGTTSVSQVSGGACTPVASGQPYTVSFYAQSVGSVAALTIKLQQASPAGALAVKIIQPPVGAWQLVSVTGIPTGTSVHPSIGIDAGGSNAVGTTDIALVAGVIANLWPKLTGGTVKIAQVQCNPGTNRVGNVATKGTALGTALVDNITATGDLASALHSSGATVRVTTSQGSQGKAAALLGNGGSTFLGKDATDHLLITSSLATSAMGLWNNNTTYTGVAGSLAPIVLASWGSGAGALSLNGSIATDTNTRSMSGTVFLGSADGTNSPWNGNLLSLEIDSGATTLTASASQPITGLTWGGFLDWNGAGFLGTLTTPTYTGSKFANYNFLHNPTSNIIGDTFGNMWASDGNLYITSGDSNGFLGTADNAVFFGSLASPGFSIPPPIGTNGINFNSLLGDRAIANGPCPAGSGLPAECEWKPTSMLALNATAAGTAHDVAILWLSRQFETNVTPPEPIFGATYSTVSYNAAEDPPWTTLANWTGLPTSQNANVASPTFGSNGSFSGALSPFPFGIAVLVSNGNQDYTPVSGDPSSLNEFVYVLLSSFNNIPGFVATARIALADIQSTSPAPSALTAVDGSGNPAKWCYLGTDAAWHGGGTGCTGSSTAWASVGTTAQNATPTAGTNAFLWVTATYIPASKRYLMTGQFQGTPTGAFAGTPGALIAAEAPAPWGPYTLISNFRAASPTSFYDPFVVANSLGTDSGRNIWIMNSGNPAATVSSGGLYTLWQTPVQVLN